MNIGVSIPSRHSNQSVDNNTYSCVYGTSQSITDYDILPEGIETFNEETIPFCNQDFCKHKYIVEGREDTGKLKYSTGDPINASNINLQDQSGSVNWNWYPDGGTVEGSSRIPLEDLN